VIRTGSVTSNGPESGKDDSKIKHEGAFLGCLEVFGDEDYPDRSYDWKVRPMSPEPVVGEAPGEREQNKGLIERIRRFKRAGRLTAIYFPLKLFGPSPRSGLTYQQRQLHQAITRELTRGKGKTSGRPDRAEIQIGGKVADENASFTVAPCPYLEARCRYVAFNGNGKGLRRHLHGRGYKLAVWMQKARYAMHEEAKEHWIEVRRFLGNLEELAELFGLVVAAWHPREHAWRAQEDLVAMTRTSAGRSWLRGCLLRIYTRDDFLLRWRRFFAARMGFSVIPDRDREQPVEAEDSLTSRAGFLPYFRKEGVSQAELAVQMHVSRSLVSQHLSGHRQWTGGWQNRVAEWIAARTG
jgi:hypothetical protein